MKDGMLQLTIPKKEPAPEERLTKVQLKWTRKKESYDIFLYLGRVERSGRVSKGGRGCRYCPPLIFFMMFARDQESITRILRRVIFSN
jgi:hypothetical protein